MVEKPKEFLANNALITNKNICSHDTLILIKHSSMGTYGIGLFKSVKHCLYKPNQQTLSPKLIIWGLTVHVLSVQQKRKKKKKTYIIAYVIFFFNKKTNKYLNNTHIF